MCESGPYCAAMLLRCWLFWAGPQHLRQNQALQSDRPVPLPSHSHSIFRSLRSSEHSPDLPMGAVLRITTRRFCASTTRAATGREDIHSGLDGSPHPFDKTSWIACELAWNSVKTKISILSIHAGWSGCRCKTIPLNASKHHYFLHQVPQDLWEVRFLWFSVGNCKSGSKCKFAHGLKELVKLDPPKIEDGGVVAFSLWTNGIYIYIYSI